METTNKATIGLPFYLALLLAAATGFIALAYEMAWARLMNFASGSRAQAFAAMLGSYLLGLAIGSLLSRRWQNAEASQSSARARVLLRLIVVSNVVAFFIVPLASWFAMRVSWVRLVPLILVGSALLGTILPLLCHLAIPADRRAGARMSYIYLANIIGSGAGSLFTGFFLMDWLKLSQLASLLLIFALVVSAMMAFSLKTARPVDFCLWAITAGLAFTSPFFHDGLYERLQKGKNYTKGYHFAQIVESRHGVITVSSNRFIFGNGVYDGIIDTKLEPESSLVRPYFVSALHPNPKEVLVIGMSGGAWTQIAANHPQVEHVTVVEISHGYLKVVKAHPQVSSLLSNPKVEIHIDDGRRWLRRNPHRRFDVILMNTSHYWREFASAVLSKEFLELVKSHLNPGGFVMWNCTESYRAPRTGMLVFPHTIMVGNNCVGSMSPLVPDRQRWSEVLRQYRVDGEPLFNLATADGRKKFEGTITFLDSPTDSSWRVMYRPEMEEKYRKAKIVTDDNLGEEYGASMRTFLRSLIPGFSML